MDYEDYILLKRIYTELKIQNDLKMLELKLMSGELKPTSNVRTKIKEIEKQRNDSIER